MKKKTKSLFFSLVIVQFLCSASEAKANKITKCDKIVEYEWEYVKLQQTCWIEDTAVIDSQSTLISAARNDQVTGLWMANNNKVAFLPEKVNEVFSNLVGYNADNCGVTSLTKLNFVGLKKLINLRLNSNPIEKIPDDAFEDLTSLEFLHMSRNKLKQINGDAFTGLTKLEKVWFSLNPCINDAFLNPESIQGLPKSVSDKCGYCKKLNDVTNCEFLKEIEQIGNENSKKVESLVKEVLQEVKSQKNQLASILEKTVKEKEKCLKDLEAKSSDVITKTSLISKLQTEVNTANILKSETEKQNSFIQKICSAHRNETEALKIQHEKSNETKKICQKQLLDQNGEISKLEAQLTAADEGKLQAESQNLMLIEEHEKLLDQLHSKFANKTEEMRKTIERLLIEIREKEALILVLKAKNYSDDFEVSVP